MDWAVDGVGLCVERREKGEAGTGEGRHEEGMAHGHRPSPIGSIIEGRHRNAAEGYG